MSGELSGRGVRLGLAFGEPDQILRLRAFRAVHPEVIVGDGGFGTLQARIPKENGETVITRHTLRELLDKLGELTGSPPGDGGAAPVREPPGGG